MTRSSRHKSHKQSKHSSRDYSGSEEDVKMEISSRDGNQISMSYRDSASGEKRKILSQVRESKNGKDPTGHGNGQVLEEYVSSKRRKEKGDVSLGGDRWNGGGEERGDGERNVEKETSGRGSMKIDSKLRESTNKGESLKIDSKNKSKRHETGSTGEGKEDSLTSAVVDKEENKGKGESKRKSERDSSTRKEKESKDKEHKLEKEKSVQETKHGVDEAKLVKVDVVKKQMSLPGDISEDRHGKRSRSNTERATEDNLQNAELEKESEKRIRRRRESSSEKDKHRNDFKEADEKQLSSRGDRAKETKYKDYKRKYVSYADKHQEDSHKEVRQRNEKNREEPDRDNKHWDDRYRENGDKETRHRDDKLGVSLREEAIHRDDKREDSHRDNRHKDEKHRENGDQDSRQKDDKYLEGTNRGHRDDKFHDDGDRDGMLKDGQKLQVGDKDIRKDERYFEDGDKDDRRRYDSLREDGDRDNGLKDGKHREDIERDTRHKERKLGDDFDREKRQRSTKYMDGYNSRDRSGEKSDPKGSRDAGYAADHHSRKSSAYDDSPTHDDRPSRYRDDQSRRKANEKEDYDVRSRSTKDQRSNAEKKSANSARMDAVPERGRPISRNADIELTSSQSRRRNSPGLSSYDAKDHFRVPKQDESKYRDVNYEERVRHNTSITRDYVGTGGSEKTSPWSVEKLGQKGDGQLGEGERRLKYDIRPSSLHLVDKSPSRSADKRQFSRSDVRRSTDVGDSTHISAGFRDVNDYSGKDGRASRESPMDVLPGDEVSQADADADALSVSSPFMRNSHFSNSSKSIPPPPPFRTGMDSPLPLGSAEDDSRGKSNNRHRRIADPNMRRIQGNAWRGIPSWPSLANGFLPFPHAPPPVGFMQPYPAPQIFGARPSMELNHPLSSPYHMSDADRFPGQVHPMAWRNQDDSFSAWDASNSGFGDESHNYGRSNWDPSRNVPSALGWETSGDLWKGNKTPSLDIPSLEKETNSNRSGNEALVGQSLKPTHSEQTQAEQQTESTGISQSSRSIEKDNGAPVVSLEEGTEVDKSSTKDDLCISYFYLSRVDISADLVEPEVFDQCTSLVGVDHNVFSDADVSKILFVEEPIEAKVAPLHEVTSYTLFPSADDSVFQKAMSLYKRNKDNFKAEVGGKPRVSSVPNSDEEDQNANNIKTEKATPLDNNMQGANNALPNFDIEVDPPSNSETSRQKLDILDDADMTEKSEELENVKVSDDSLPPEVKEVAALSSSDNEEMKLPDTKNGPFLNNDVSSEVAAVMRDSVMSNLSWIHHSSESTH